jgi:hypothetical protein
MMQFNQSGKLGSLTYRECLEPAMQITDKQEAEQYLKDYVCWIDARRDELDERSAIVPSIQIAKQNLAYYAGYYGEDVRARVEELFICAHPIFGSIKDNGSPTAEEAFKIGMQMGQQ